MSSTSRRCIKEDGASTYTWQCSRRSHPVQRMGGVCAICLTERLSNITRCRPPRLPDQASCASLRFAAPSLESMDSEGIPPNHNMLTQVDNSVQQCDNSMGLKEMSARHSSAGSEQSIASLIEREIDEGRHRYSDVTAGFSMLPPSLKDLGAPESSNERRAAAACAKQQLARSRSYSTNSHFNSIHSTPASCKSNSSLLSGGDSCKPCSGRTDSTTSSNFRTCNTSVAAAAVERSSNHALLTKSKSTGSNYNGIIRHANKLRSPIHVWNLPHFWHKKCNHMETRYDSDNHYSVIVQADDSVPFMKLPHASSKNGGGAANCINRDMMCLGKWLNRSTPSSWHLTRRRTTSCKGSSSTTIMQARHTCTEEPLNITQDLAASSSSTAAGGSNCSDNVQVTDVGIAKGIFVCGRWRLPSFNMSQKGARCRGSTIDYTPDLGLGVISATNQNRAYELCEMQDTFDDEYSNLRGHKTGAGSVIAALASAHSQNVEEGADNECIDEECKTDECNIDGAAGVISAINHEIPHCDTAGSSSTSTYMSRNRGSDHLLNKSSQFTFRSRVEYTPSLYSGHAMKMHPNIMNQCQSIAALVSMDANLIYLI